MPEKLFADLDLDLNPGDQTYTFVEDFVDENPDPADDETLIVQQLESGSALTSGTGTYVPFLRQNATGQDAASQGYNTDDSASLANNNGEGLDMDGPTMAIQLKDIPIVIGPDGQAYYEIRLDLNEENNDGTDGSGEPNKLLELSEFQLYYSDSQAVLEDYLSPDMAFADGVASPSGNTYNLAFDLDAGEDRSIILRDSNAGSGQDDYIFYIPLESFADADPDDYITLFSQFGPSPVEGATFEEWRIRTTSEITGFKFNDIDNDGNNDDGNVQQGIEGIMLSLFQDSNGNGTYEEGVDPLISTTETNADGSFAFFNLLPGTYFVVEEVPDGAILTTGPYETVVISEAGEDISGVEIGNHYLTPDVAIDKSASVDGDCADVVGEAITYTVLVNNNGELDLTDVVVTDSFEGGADERIYVDGDTDMDGVLDAGETWAGDTDGDGELDVGETWTFTYDRTVTQEMINSNGGGDGELSNVATVNASSTQGDVSDFDDATIDICQDPVLLIDKTGTTDQGEDCADVVGENINWTIEVSRAGNVDIDEVVVTDDRGTPVYQSGDDGDGILEEGEVWVYTFSETVTQDMINANAQIVNTAYANGEAVNSNTAAPEVQDDATIDICQDPVLLIDKTGTTDQGEDCADVVGENINWTIEVSRAGNVDIDEVVVTDDRGTPVYQSGDDGDGILEEGEVWVYTFSETVTQDMINANAQIVNTAYANGEAVNSNTAAPEVQDDATIDICQDPVLLIDKTGTTDQGEDCADVVGENINWTIEVSRAGNVDIDEVVVTDDRGTPVYQSGDDGDGILEEGEVWVYTFSETVTQDMINANAQIVNTAYANGEAVNSNTAAPEVQDDATIDICQDPVLLIDKTGTTDQGEDCADVVGENINWTIEVSRAGNVDIDEVVVTDDRGTPVYQSGDDGDGILEEGEVWVYTFSETVTQDMINANAQIVNTAYANGEAVNSNTAAPEVQDDATIDICQDPVLLIDKTGTTDQGEDCADVVGENINWTIEVSRAGNVDIDEVVVTDDRGTPVYQSGDDGDGILEEGEVWVYTFSETVTQDMIDANAQIVNTAYANGEAVNSNTAAPEVQDDATIDVCQEPSIDVEKTVKTNLFDFLPEDGDDDPDGLQAGTGSIVQFRVSVVNDGNVTLSGITLQDTVTHTVNAVETMETIVYSPDGDPTTLDAFDVFIDLNDDGIEQAGEAWSNFDTDGDGVIDAGAYAELSPDESFTLYYSINSELGQHENTATATGYAATTNTEATDSDDANYFVLPEDCVGVGTPGFWSNNGAPFWDGEVGNELKAGEPGFADGELTYDVYLEDTNNDNVVDSLDDPSAVQGLLLGDYNGNGYEDNGENTLFISLADAQELIDASGRQVNGKQADGAWIIGRDAVASWLNFLANGGEGGGCFGDVADDGLYSPEEALNDAIAWLQDYVDNNGDGILSSQDIGLNGGKKSAIVQTKSNAWQDEGAAIHEALDEYNNTGTIDGEFYCCDRDDQYAIEAISQIKEYESNLLLESSLVGGLASDGTKVFDDAMVIESNTIV